MINVPFLSKSQPGWVVQVPVPVKQKRRKDVELATADQAVAAPAQITLEALGKKEQDWNKMKRMRYELEQVRMLTDQVMVSTCCVGVVTWIAGWIYVCLCWLP